MEISQVEQNFKEFLKSVNMVKKRSYNEHWNNILRFTYENLKFVTDKNVICACCKLLLNSLIEFQCNDKSVLKRFLELCWKVSICDGIVTSLSLIDKKKFTLETWSWRNAFIVSKHTGVSIFKVLIKYGLYGVPQDATYTDFLDAKDFLMQFW